MNRVSALNEPRALDYPNIRRVEAVDDAPDGYDRRVLSVQLLQLETIRRFEEWLVDHEALVHGPVHSSIGQEAVAVGAATAASRRRHDHIDASRPSPCPQQDDELLRRPASIRSMPARYPRRCCDCVRRTLAEILGLATGWAGGRGGSMHLFDLRVRGCRHHGDRRRRRARRRRARVRRAAAADPVGVAVTFLGDGAASIGGVPRGHQHGSGLESARDLRRREQPVLGRDDRSGNRRLRRHRAARRGPGHARPGRRRHGRPRRRAGGPSCARVHAVAGAGPVLIEAKTYRYRHQSGKLPGSAFRYRTKDEEAEWLQRDPLHDARRVVARARAARRRRDRARSGARRPSSWSTRPLACTRGAGETDRDPRRALAEPADADRGVRGDPQRVRRVDGRRAPTPTAEARRASASRRRSHARLHGRSSAIPRVHSRRRGQSPAAEARTARPRMRSRRPRARAEHPDCRERLLRSCPRRRDLPGCSPIVELMFPDFALEARRPAASITSRRHDTSTAATCRCRSSSAREPPRAAASGRSTAPTRRRCSLCSRAGGSPRRRRRPSTSVSSMPRSGARIPVLVIEHHASGRAKGELPTGDLDYVLAPGTRRAALAQGESVTVLTWSDPLHRVARHRGRAGR